MVGLEFFLERNNVLSISYLLDICIHLQLWDVGGELVLLLLEISVLILWLDQGIDAQKWLDLTKISQTLETLFSVTKVILVLLIKVISDYVIQILYY